MNKLLINAGLQLVPLENPAVSFPLVDQCIELIRNSGLLYKVSAMETVVEGGFEEVQQLVNTIYQQCQQYQMQYLLNVRYHFSVNENVKMEDKTNKFDSQ